jgi:hypothetical protein
VRLAAAAAAASTLAANPAIAGSDEDEEVTIVYGIPPFAPAVPPAGYVLDPSDQRASV